MNSTLTLAATDTAPFGSMNPIRYVAAQSKPNQPAPRSTGNVEPSVLVRRQAERGARRLTHLPAVSAVPGRIAARKIAHTRLPGAISDCRENRVYALLAVLCLVALAGEAYGEFRAAAGWHDFVRVVQQLLA
jgi:hypothetical protein